MVDALASEQHVYGGATPDTMTQFRQAEKEYQRSVKEIFKQRCVYVRWWQGLRESLLSVSQVALLNMCHLDHVALQARWEEAIRQGCGEES